MEFFLRAYLEWFLWNFTSSTHPFHCYFHFRFFHLFPLLRWSKFLFFFEHLLIALYTNTHMMSIWKENVNEWMYVCMWMKNEWTRVLKTIVKSSNFVFNVSASVPYANILIRIVYYIMYIVRNWISDRKGNRNWENARSMNWLKCFHWFSWLYLRLAQQRST